MVDTGCDNPLQFYRDLGYVAYMVLLYMERIFQALNTHDVRYVLVGGMAVNLHGFDRATGDIDVVISLGTGEVQKFIACIQELGFVPRVPVRLEEFADPEKRAEWCTQKHMQVFSVYNPKNPMELLDVLMESPVNFDLLYRDHVPMESQGIAIPVASIPHLIQMKEASGRERDRMDIRALQAILEIQNDTTHS